jgi:hypothetical protein
VDLSGVPSEDVRVSFIDDPVAIDVEAVVVTVVLALLPTSDAAELRLETSAEIGVDRRCRRDTWPPVRTDPRGPGPTGSL